VRPGRVPRLGRDVDPVDGVQLLAVTAAALTRPGHGVGRYRAPRRVLPLLITLMGVVALAAGCSSGGGSSGSSSSLGSASSVVPSSPPGSASVPVVTGTVATLPSGVAPSGFEAVTLRITGADGRVRESCVLLAANDADRARGLMDVDNLGGYDGMIFRFDAPTRSRFYMFQTRLPLSVAFFDDKGGFVSATDMAPCTAAAGSDCPLYAADGPYADALEMVQGGLAPWGIAAGSRIEVGDHCSRSP